jgi:hypothetical protein
MPKGRALRQGKWDASDSFFVRYHSEDGQFLMAAVFHQSVILMADLHPGAATVGHLPWEHQFLPVAETGITLIKTPRTVRFLR